MYTAYPREAARWRRLGFDVTALAGGWEATGPLQALRLRRVKNGSVIKRRMPVAGLLAPVYRGGETTNVGGRPSPPAEAVSAPHATD